MARKLIFYNSLRRKQRGQKRKLKRLIEYVSEFETSYTSKYPYECFRTPCSLDFINSKKTYGKIKTEFCRAWLNKTKEFIEQKPDNNKFIKIVAHINTEDLWGAQINIFYDEEYYLNFFKRNTNLDEHKLIDNKSLKSMRNISSDLSEIGFKENYSYYDEDEDTYITICNELWHYGEFPKMP